MRGHRDQQPRRHRGEEDPARAQHPRRRRRVGIVGRHVQRRRLRRRAQQQHAAAAISTISSAIAAGPDQVLRAQREHRLQQHRIGQQRQEAADIRGGIEEVRIGTVGMAGADEPGLQQRIVGGEREERQPDRHREQAEQPERIARGRRHRPSRSRSTAAASASRPRSSTRWIATGMARLRQLHQDNAHRHSRRAAATGRTPSPPTTPPASRRAAAAPSW